MGGRTKKTAKAIASSMSDYEVDFFPIEMVGKFIGKIKMLDRYEKGNYGELEAEMNALDAKDYDLVIFGSPTYGSETPKTFLEVLKRMKNLNGKKAIVFATARFSGGKTVEFMKTKVEEAGAQVINKAKFRRMFYLGVRKSTKFGKEINEG
ncbi:MAG: flavodoxin family protein [Candidatus Heimdallarchaeota archaeon]